MVLDGRRGDPSDGGVTFAGQVRRRWIMSKTWSAAKSGAASSDLFLQRVSQKITPDQYVRALDARVLSRGRTKSGTAARSRSRLALRERIRPGRERGSATGASASLSHRRARTFCRNSHRRGARAFLIIASACPGASPSAALSTRPKGTEPQGSRVSPASLSSTARHDGSRGSHRASGARVTKPMVVESAVVIACRLFTSACFPPGSAPAPAIGRTVDIRQRCASTEP